VIMPNTLRQKLAAGQPTVGTHYLSADPDLPEIIGDTGLFDYAEFAAEYSTFDMQLLYHMARAGQCAGLPLMIKLDQESQGFWAQAALGAGFKAVLFTDIRTAEDVAACHRVIRADTPEAGGVMGVKLRRPLLSGYNPDGYLADLAGIVLAVMIEKGVAVENLDEVLEAARAHGVDMTQWGPADFGLSRGMPGLMHAPEIRPFEEWSSGSRSSTACRPALRSPKSSRLSVTSTWAFGTSASAGTATSIAPRSAGSARACAICSKRSKTRAATDARKAWSGSRNISGYLTSTSIWHRLRGHRHNLVGGVRG
jgi:2-keto-3-deoxy-L-rhamnonate aldolase RhmA